MAQEAGNESGRKAIMKTMPSRPICRSLTPWKRAATPVMVAYEPHRIWMVRFTSMNTASTTKR